jgi:FKBP12-rapamycin complex-associated protein
MAMDALITSDTVSDRATLMFNLLCRGGMNSKDERVLISASKTLGRLIHVYGHSVGDLIDAEIVRSLEWLIDSKSGHTFAALLIIFQIAANSPPSIYLHLSQLLDVIWLSLHDRDLNIRLAAKDTLQITLRLIDDRQLPSAKHNQQVKVLYEVAVKCLEQSNQKSDHLHGALLALNELGHYHQYVTEDSFQHLCDVVMKFWDTHNALLRPQVTSLLPALARLYPQQFSQRHLAAIMKPLLSALVQRDATERARAFVTVGKLALAIRSYMQDYVDEILAAVRTAVSSKSKSVFKEALVCVSMLSTAGGVSIQKYARELLKQIFSGGLSQELIGTLTALSQNIPELSFDIQLRLIDAISRVLTKANLVQSGSQSRKLDKSSTLHDAEYDRSRIILALQTVGSFNFDLSILMEFSDNLLTTYLSHKDTEIRKESCLMCCKILSRLPATTTTNDILSKLLETGIADVDESIRLTIILNLDTSFDVLLAQHDKLSLLFLGLYDQSLEIREHIVRILGRCATRNPAYVLPVLRKRLLELRDELAYSRDSVVCEKSARLLACLVGGPDFYTDISTTFDNALQCESEMQHEKSIYSPVHNRLVDPYVDSLLRVLVNRAKDADPRTVASVLRAISALVYQAPLELTTEHIEDLLKLIADVLQDHSSTLKRVMALKCLAVVGQFTSPAMKSALHSSKVYETVLEMLRTDQLPGIRYLITSVMGTFGAVDSQWHRRMQLEDLKSSEKSAHRILFDNSGGDACASTVVESLLRIISDQSLGAHHRQALQALVFLFDNLGRQCVHFFRAVLDSLLVLIRNCDSLLREITLQQLAGLMSVIKEDIREFLPEVMLLIGEYWQVHSMQFLLLIEVAAVALNEDFAAFVPQITPYLLTILQEPSYQRLVKIKALHSVELLNSLLTRQMYVIVPAITSLFTTSAPYDVSHEAIATANKLAQRVDLSRYASAIVQPLTRVLNTRPDRQDVAMQLLCSLATQMRYSFTVFVPSIRNVLTQNNIVHIAYNKLEERLLRDELEDDDEALPEDNQPNLARSELREYKQKLKVNEQLLRKAWNTSSKVTAEDWQDWFRRFSIELLRESSSPSVRSCLVLADYYPLVRKSFKSHFTRAGHHSHKIPRTSSFSTS